MNKKENGGGERFNIYAYVCQRLPAYSSIEHLQIRDFSTSKDA